MGINGGTLIRDEIENLVGGALHLETQGSTIRTKGYCKQWASNNGISSIDDICCGEEDIGQHTCNQIYGWAFWIFQHASNDSMAGHDGINRFAGGYTCSNQYA